ncbi:ABC transporter permease [Halopiger xanaduensis]|uniref:ABC-type transporter, integral membrane subunit n=1 Tax=Halopiger xanaduensis (strain DSM 18323 / JCM 14033 / SH-6) TaxID=797210 RepID=F8DDI7_HALXS|nr:ABC transporter permease [Halopiger xanaduensis]AEH39081.1 ABC-type transporter, integral membrane subunit [Halopiger xanaduensis SH-6]
MKSTDRSSTDHPFERVSEVSSTDGFDLSRWLEEHVLVPVRILAEDRKTIIGVSILTVYVLMGTVGVLLVPEPTTDGPRLQAPFQSLEYPLGTDAMGHDLLAMIVHATPQMLQMILAGAVFATAVATVVGTVAGYKGGLADDVLTLVMDVMLTVPGLPLIIVLAATIEPSNPLLIGVLLTINTWAGLARTIRAEVLSLRNDNYVEAARLMGTPTWRIIAEDIVPNIMPYVLINFMMAGRSVIFSAVGLYFLGLLPFTALNWGVILDMASSNGALSSTSTIHWVIVPTVVIIALSYGLIMLSQGMDRLFNPRVRARKRD